MTDVSMFMVAIFVPLAIIVGGCLLIGLAIYRHTRLKELAFRERLAMIEKGLVPPEESHPVRSDRAKYRSVALSRRAIDRGIKMRTGGVLLIGVGLGLAVLISFAGGDPLSGVGVGGGIAILGLAFLVNGLMSSRYPALHDDPVPPPSSAQGGFPDPPSGT